MKRRVAPLARSAPIPSWWQPLFETSGCISVFLSAAWLQSWLEVYGGDFDGEWVHWEDDGRVVGGCLLLERVIRVKGVPLRSVFLNLTGIASRPTPLAEFNDVLHLPGHGDAIAADLARLLLSKPWSRCFLSGYEDGSVFASLALHMGSAYAERETRAAPYIDMSLLGERSFETTLTGSTGTRVRKHRRQCEAQWGELSARPAASLDEALQFFADLTRLHLARWEAQGEATTLSSPDVLDFHKRLIGRLWDGGCVELVRVGTSEHAIGYLYNFIIDRKVFFFQSGFEYEQDASRSPGMLTHTLAIEHYRQRAMREYDFLAGDTRYKRSLANSNRDLHWAVLYGDQLWARAFLFGRRVWSRLADKKLAAERI
jgi:hypothetical protein